MMMQARWKYWLFGVLAIFLIFSFYLIYNLGVYVGQYDRVTSGQSIDKDRQEFIEQGQDLVGDDLDFALFYQVWDLIKDNYIDRDELNSQDLFYGALSGLVEATGDPYSMFLDPELFNEFEISLTGTFEGIGAEVGMRDEVITIVAPLEGRPADLAGLRSGDQVLKIDNELTFGFTVMEAVQKIRGDKGTEVVLTVVREGKDQPLDIAIKRAVIHVNSVKTEWQDDIYVIKINNFAEDTSALFNEAVNEATLKEPKGIILDLRNNPGGFFQTSIAMASEWIDQGVVVSEDFGNGVQKDYQSHGRDRLAGFPTIVLVNQGSASASEIVAGALKDHGQATIVGKQTFGKGTVQSLHELVGGSAVKITNAKWLTPDGYDMSEAGIIPDVEVEYTVEDWENDIDPQFDKAIELLNN